MTQHSVSTLNEVAKLKLLALSPELAQMKPARPIITGKRAQELIAAIAKKGLPLQENRAGKPSAQ